jgi:hypothetical protein
MPFHQILEDPFIITVEIPLPAIPRLAISIANETESHEPVERKDFLVLSGCCCLSRTSHLVSIRS